MESHKRIYQVKTSSEFPKSIKTLPKDVLVRLIPKILNLQIESRGTGSKKLLDRPGYRVRIRKYRLVYDINDTSHIIKLLTVTKREDL